MRVLVLGGYGFIGLAIARRLRDAGHEVTGLGRAERTGPRLLPSIRWVRADLARLQRAADWKPLLSGVDVVVNAAGVLQDGLRDDVEQIHHGAVAALVAAIAEGRAIRLVQVSAPGARIDSSTEFMRSKARGDRAVAASRIDWVILRPGLVLGPNAYGGSALLRALAAFPVILPIALPERRVQVVAASDVAQVVLEAVEGAIPARTDVDLVEDTAHTLREIVERLRAWMGIAPARAILPAPVGGVALAAACADLLGRLGWRPPLRSTAIRALRDEVVGDPAPLRGLRGSSLASLDRVLEAMPAGLRERWFARLYLLLPLMVGTLSVFWIVSGVVGAFDVERAARSIPEGIMAPRTASLLVVAGSGVDVALGIAILARPLARAACFGMLLVSFVYLTAASVVAGSLWLDPLGPLVKVLPAMVLALATSAFLEER